MSNDLKVIPITKTMLREAINQNTYWGNKKLVPLPKSKALWIISNPRIEEEDFCGVLGFEGDTMISFIFMFPDVMNGKGGQTKKIYWMLLWWVDTAYKNTVLGTYIYNEAIHLAGKNVLIKSYAENVNEFYEKQPFDVIIARERHTIFFNLDTSILLGKFSFLKPFKIVINPISKCTGWLVRGINTNKLGKKIKELAYDYIEVLDEESWQLVDELCKNDLILKTKEYVNWQIDKKQYTQTPVPTKFPYRALQAGYGENITIHNFKIILKHKIIGFVSYVINHSECNVKYFLVKDQENYSICVDALMEHITRNKSNFLFTDDDKLASTINQRYMTIFHYKIVKKGLAHKEMKLDKDLITFSNRDGHFY